MRATILRGKVVMYPSADYFTSDHCRKQKQNANARLWLPTLNDIPHLSGRLICGLAIFNPAESRKNKNNIWLPWTWALILATTPRPLKMERSLMAAWKETHHPQAAAQVTKTFFFLFLHISWTLGATFEVKSSAPPTEHDVITWHNLFTGRPVRFKWTDLTQFSSWPWLKLKNVGFYFCLFWGVTRKTR